MDINKAIILNSQFNDVLAAIENLTEMMNKSDVNEYLQEQVQYKLDELENETMRLKNNLSKELDQ